MPWKFSVKVSKHAQSGYTIIAGMLEGPRPGAFSDWDSPHPDWLVAKEHFREKLLAQHADGDTYVYGEVEYSSVEALMGALDPGKG